MERTKTDWYLLFIFLFIAIGCSLLMLYYYVHHVNYCVKDPLNYYVEETKSNLNAPVKISGSVTIMGKWAGWIIPFGDNSTNNITTFKIEQPEIIETRNITIDNKTYSFIL